MIRFPLVRGWIVLPVLALSCLAGAGRLPAEDLYLAEGDVFPGQLWVSRDGERSMPLHRREAQADPAFPRAIMKLQQVAVGTDSQVFYASGLDGSIMHLLDGRHEIQAFEVSGQVRDLACTAEEHTVYFSLLPTPQNGEPLADGLILRRDLWEGQPTEVVHVRQADVGGNWWGTFTLSDGLAYVATLDNPSRIYQVTQSGAVRVFESNRFAIQGLAAGAEGEFYFTSGGKVFRTADFNRVESIHASDRAWADVATPLTQATDRNRKGVAEKGTAASRRP